MGSDYDTACDRQYSRALTKLMALQSRRPNPAKPYFPEYPSGQTWADEPENENVSTTKRTPEIVETKGEE